MLSHPASGLQEVLGAQVRGEDHHCVREVHGATLPVRQAAIVEHLEEDVQDLRVGLLHLVEEHDVVGPAPHGLRELPALLVADIAWRRPDEAGDGVLLHVLAHVHAHDVPVVIEELLSQGLRQLGLAHTSGAQEEERARRLVLAGQASSGAQHSLRHLVRGVVLALDSLTEPVCQGEQALPLRLVQLAHGDASPAGDHLHDLLRLHHLREHLAALLLVAAASASLGLGRLDFLLLQALPHVGNGVVAQVRSSLDVAAALGSLRLELEVLELLLEFPQLIHSAALHLEAQQQGLQLLGHGGDLLLHHLQALLGSSVLLLAQGCGLDLQLHLATLQGVNLLGAAVQLHTP
mmetsp:Transcript_37123/g.80687  ORF Transcript_37123/g.80687 Transcript_37123/m.80687 type:complete len:348 (-) Transcript_37123:1389-2432(-)